MERITDYFGSLVFNDEVMKEKLSPEVYASLKKTMDEGVPLDTNVASAVAEAMKDWATERGATHFTHWFQPLTGITAEKHDSFISHDKAGRVLLEFSGRELIKGEPDASSFPTGGLRATFEARGYTAWDPTSYAFIKDKTLCIPTAFCSYGGEALDKKTPLLRSMEALSRQALRIVRLFGNTEARSVRTCVGPEQEYFLIDKKTCEQRKDLVFTGRTLFGAKPPKGQELDDHYFGAIKPRVAEFMEDLDRQLWELGIFAKTEHNEVAPAQHELAPIYTTTNIATDHNQLTMEIMQKVAARHGLVCLLHNKPFAGVNGSGKHNNWSLQTDNGVNLFRPGDTPYENAQFLLFLCAVIKAVDEYADLLRLSAAEAGNDHRLGGNEAPPAVVSMFLGDELTGVLEAIENDAPYNKTERKEMLFGVASLPKFFRDTTDRNRTSPFAFTGNKFEFRMLGASNSIACTNIMLNAAVSDVLRGFADRLEDCADFDTELHTLLKETLKQHKRILFNGNGYGAEWIEEAKRRGLPHRRTTPDALPHLLDRKNAEMLTRTGVFSETELRARCEILLENYTKTVAIEAATMADMSRRQIMPAVSAYGAELACRIEKKTGIGGVTADYELETAKRLAKLLDVMNRKTDELEKTAADIRDIEDVTEHSYAIRDRLIPVMEELRAAADEAETLTAEEFWPFPTYEKLLFSVN
ncbi:MAG: glutamine synthetase III [Clostridia bacterium]|nr:glutamine synthetase III [Clostridia bacterium]